MSNCTQYVNLWDSLSEWRSRLSATLQRLNSEIDSLSRRGNLNLVLGMATGLVGVALLGYLVLADTRKTETVQEFALIFLPRLSIVAIIEVFAYFFLRLYRSSLIEIKYFQNEATNVEFWNTGLAIALQLNSSELLAKSVEAFIRVERNPLFAAGTTSFDLEQEKNYAKPGSMSLDHLVTILSAAASRVNK